jgi:hypothetical protein
MPDGPRALTTWFWAVRGEVVARRSKPPGGGAENYLVRIGGFMETDPTMPSADVVVSARARRS